MKPHKTYEDISNLLHESLSNNKLMKMALAQTAMSHRFHTRDDGKSYLEQHIYPLTFEVYNYFLNSPLRDNAVIVALLHDVPEEDPTCPLSRIEKEYGTEIATLVAQMQKKRKETSIRTQADRHEEHLEFVERLRKAPVVVQTVGILDKLNNAICTVGTVDRAKYTRFTQDTEALFMPIARAIDSNLADRLQNEINRIKEELHT